MLKLQDAYHTGMLVGDLETAIAEYARTFETEFTEIRASELSLRGPGGPFSLSTRIAYTREGPHRIELVEAVPGTPWEQPANSIVGPVSAHHMGFWCDDVAGQSRELAARGCPLVATLADDPDEAHYLAYHRMPNGLLIELVDSAVREGIEKWLVNEGPWPSRPVREQSSQERKNS